MDGTNMCIGQIHERNQPSISFITSSDGTQSHFQTNSKRFQHILKNALNKWYHNFSLAFPDYGEGPTI